MAQNHIQWQDLILVVLTLWALLPQLDNNRIFILLAHVNASLIAVRW